MRYIKIGQCQRLDDDGRTVSDARGRCAACHASKIGDESLCRGCAKADRRGEIDARLERLRVERDEAERRALGLSIDRPVVVEAAVAEPARNFIAADELARMMEARDSRKPPVAIEVQRGRPLETTGAAPSTTAGASGSCASRPLTRERRPEAPEEAKLLRRSPATSTPPSSPALTPSVACPTGSKARVRSRAALARTEPRATITRSSGCERDERPHARSVASSAPKSTRCSACERSRVAFGPEGDPILHRRCPKHLDEDLQRVARERPSVKVRVVALWDRAG